jgi:flagellin
MLQRMRELAVQSSNATNSKSDREALQAELSQLRDEVDRVAKTTSFNGQKLLDGKFTGAMFQVGANSGDNITVGALANTKVAELGNSTYGTTTDLDASAVASAAKASISQGAVTISITGAKGGTPVDAKIEQDVNVTEDEALGKVIAAINSKTADTGVTAFLSDDKTKIELRATENQDDGEDIADIAIASASIAAVEVNAGGFTAGGGKGIDAIKIDTQSGAWEALQRIDQAIDKVNTARGELGAIQTRFEKAVENIDIQSENITTARGRITDADFAKETANLSRTQILQQAGTAMVAQANQLPQQVLSLLR